VWYLAEGDLLVGRDDNFTTTILEKGAARVATIHREAVQSRQAPAVQSL
jgi:hypothetical protein